MCCYRFSYVYGFFSFHYLFTQPAPQSDPARCRHGVNSILPSNEHVIKTIHHLDAIANKYLQSLSVSSSSLSSSTTQSPERLLPIVLMTTVDAIPDVINAITTAFPGRLVYNVYAHPPTRAFLDTLPSIYRTDYSVEMIEKVLCTHAVAYAGNLFSSISSTVFDWRYVHGVPPDLSIVM